MGRKRCMPRKRTIKTRKQTIKTRKPQKRETTYAAYLEATNEDKRKTKQGKNTPG